MNLAHLADKLATDIHKRALRHLANRIIEQGYTQMYQQLYMFDGEPPKRYRRNMAVISTAVGPCPFSTAHLQAAAKQLAQFAPAVQTDSTKHSSTPASTENSTADEPEYCTFSDKPADPSEPHCWIDRNGKPYFVDFFMHSHAARDIVKLLGMTLPPSPRFPDHDMWPDDYLEMLGWLHISDGHVHATKKPPTQAQLDSVFDLLRGEIKPKFRRGLQHWFNKIMASDD